MGFVFKDDRQTLKAINFSNEFAVYDPIFFGDAEFKMTKNLIEYASLSNHIKLDSGGIPPRLPPTNSSGEYVFLGPEGKEVILPNQYNNLLLSCASIGHTQTEFTVLPSFLEELLNWIRKFLKAKQTLFTQVEEVLNDADNIYANLRDEIKKLQVEHGDDQLLHLILFIPDLFVYLCRILADEDVSLDAKVELGIALVYVISPIDFLPEAFINHPIAMVDDSLIVLAAIWRSMKDGYVTEEQFKKHWPGEPAFIDKIEEYIESIKKVFGDKGLLIFDEFLNKKSKKKKTS